MNKAALILAKHRIWPNHKLYGFLTGLAMAGQHCSPEELNVLNELTDKNTQYLTNENTTSEQDNKVA